MSPHASRATCHMSPQHEWHVSTRKLNPKSMHVRRLCHKGTPRSLVDSYGKFLAWLPRKSVCLQQARINLPSCSPMWHKSGRFKTYNPSLRGLGSHLVSINLPMVYVCDMVQIRVLQSCHVHGLCVHDVRHMSDLSKHTNQPGQADSTHYTTAKMQLASDKLIGGSLPRCLPQP